MNGGDTEASGRNGQWAERTEIVGAERAISEVDTRRMGQMVLDKRQSMNSVTWRGRELEKWVLLLWQMIETYLRERFDDKAAS